MRQYSEKYTLPENYIRPVKTPFKFDMIELKLLVLDVWHVLHCYRAHHVKVSLESKSKRILIKKRTYSCVYFNQIIPFPFFCLSSFTIFACSAIFREILNT